MGMKSGKGDIADDNSYTATYTQTFQSQLNLLIRSYYNILCKKYLLNKKTDLHKTCETERNPTKIDFFSLFAYVWNNL